MCWARAVTLDRCSAYTALGEGRAVGECEAPAWGPSSLWRQRLRLGASEGHPRWDPRCGPSCKTCQVV